MIGSDTYPVNDFIEENESRLKYSTNESISIMALSSEQKSSENIQDYQKICNLTKEGMFVNIVNKGTRADSVAKSFFSTMDVYPSNQYPIVNEFF